MCAIFGVYNASYTSKVMKRELVDRLAFMAESAVIRGRDAVGIGVFAAGHAPKKYAMTFQRGSKFAEVKAAAAQLVRTALADLHEEYADTITVIGNCRAEPTTEWLKNPTPNDIQPYTNAPHNNVWTVHNGTIANDEKFIPEHALTKVDSQAIPYAIERDDFTKLVGSVASVSYVIDTNELYVMRNYRPLSLKQLNNTLYFHSSKSALFQVKGYDVELKPNTTRIYEAGGTLLDDMHVRYETTTTFDKTEPLPGYRSVVVLSGGLDSTVVAHAACSHSTHVLLVHFHYGCRAQSKETEAVLAVHKWLKEHPDNQGKSIELQFIELDFLRQLGGNPLTDHTMEVAQGKDGIEYANEWVPFRNGLMVSMVIALCDRFGYNRIYTGVNLEEAGAFGDNEEEFYEVMQEAAAIGSKSHPKFLNPLAHSMKHEIVKIAMAEGAPVHLSWSCYHGGEKHCGKCGPCLLRKTAFAMNDIPDVIEYEDNDTVVGL